MFDGRSGERVVQFHVFQDVRVGQELVEPLLDPFSVFNAQSAEVEGGGVQSRWEPGPTAVDYGEVVEVWHGVKESEEEVEGDRRARDGDGVQLGEHG